MNHRSLAELEPHLEHLAASPKDVGILELLVCRPAKGTRRILDEGVLDTRVVTAGSARPGDKATVHREPRSGEARPPPSRLGMSRPEAAWA